MKDALNDRGHALRRGIARHLRGDNEPLSEDRAALEFGRLHGGSLRYCRDLGGWLRWTGSIWRRDSTGRAFHWARELARGLAAEGEDKVLITAGRASFAGGVEKFARADPIFARTADEFDRNPWLAGGPTCVVDLRSGLTLPPDPNFNITKSLAVDPAANADCPLWTRFIDETFGGDQALIRFIRQFLGYALTGEISEHALLYGYGGGGNGKTVLLNTAQGVMGDYAMAAPMDVFTTGKFERHPTELAMLRGARLVTASETEPGKVWAEARIKQLTGGDPVSARFMRRDFFEFRPSFKLFFVGNHRPSIRHLDDAMRRRFNIVPFDHHPASPDPALEQKLRPEWPAILRWMIDGALDWQTNGLVRPPSVLRATGDYFGDQDVFGQWLSDCCELGPRLSDTTGALFGSWKGHAEQNGEPPGDTKVFAEAMRQRGLEPYHTARVRGYRGVRLRPARGVGDG